MSAEPQFGTIPIIASAVVSATADTSYTAPTNTIQLLKATTARQFTDGATTNASSTVTSAAGASFANGDIGRPISGTNIPVGAVITAVASATSVTISSPATGSASSLTLTLGGGIGMKVVQLQAQGTGTTVAGVLNYYLYDGATYHYWDSDVVTVVTPSTTTAPFQATTTYTNLWLPSGWSLNATSFVASQLINIVAIGAAF